MEDTWGCFIFQKVKKEEEIKNVRFILYDCFSIEKKVEKEGEKNRDKIRERINRLIDDAWVMNDLLLISFCFKMFCPFFFFSYVGF